MSPFLPLKHLQNVRIEFSFECTNKRTQNKSKYFKCIAAYLTIVVSILSEKVRAKIIISFTYETSPFVLKKNEKNVPS